MMFEILTNWYVNYCGSAMAWCAAHPVVTGIGLIVDAIVVVACAVVTVVYVCKLYDYLASKANV